MRFLLDQGLPQSLAPLLCDAGIETIHVAALAMSTADDTDIIEHATKENFACVTLDADFQSIVALSGKTCPSVIRFRIEGLKAKGYLQILSHVVPEIQDDIEAGAFVSIQESGVRVRRLPVM